MSDDQKGLREELSRVRRVADQLCTAHAKLRDRYARRAIIFDTAILLLSAWSAVVALIDPSFNIVLTPFGLQPQLWVGLLGIGVFLLVLIQLKTDWKGRSEAHARTFAMYTEVKREAGYLLAGESEITQREFMRLKSRYDMASDTGAGVPEALFLPLKRDHRLKVALSKYLDDKPGAMIWLARLNIVLKDTCGWKRMPSPANTKTENKE